MSTQEIRENLREWCLDHRINASEVQLDQFVDELTEMVYKIVMKAQVIDIKPR